MTSTVVLIIAAILDYLIADPINWLHPVQVMGWIISGFTKLSWRFCQTSWTQRLAGIFLGIFLITGSGAIAILMIQVTRWLNPILGIVMESILLASCFATKSLKNAAENVLQPLISGDIERSRLNLSQFVGRDTENLSKAEILRAVLETVTENATDGVMAPLFYAIIGGLIPGVGSVPLALAYKASSTLDSMVGYKEAPYTYLGWFSAKTEDFLTWIPCRLTVVTLALISAKPMQVWRLCDRDARKDSSPNSGWSECAYAAILSVQMGGPNSYKGVIKDKPLLGDNIYPIQPETIYQALQLTRYCFLLWLGVATSLLLIAGISEA
ncbi:adenosylcobinamide-phosphate synthase CbiB [Brunnivagina elsteri]|uniref:Cobalamin biosynthesis protein CobD n=1 Tax=Brunnivagina elsteri CCALA 953 TaxID=987040 RepID=A0A2A2TCR5_9CYAN|nr:adenosylcobinamide-phosphate synthase CbiB [Calothrix elsteri]PAX51554.1 cobalamin biosynthesis protein [Calothrix elsteri CCALA 953]